MWPNGSEILLHGSEVEIVYPGDLISWQFSVSKGVGMVACGGGVGDNVVALTATWLSCSRLPNKTRGTGRFCREHGNKIAL